MKISPTVALTLILLSLMIGAGVVSASWGYTLGRQALKGVKQPDVRPSSGVNSSGAPHRNEVMILREEDILTDVKARISGEAAPAASPEASANLQNQSANSGSIEVTPVSSNTLVSTNSTSPQAGFPITSQDQGIQMQVESVSQQAGSLVLSVSLQNSGSQPVQFLYSFMDITDNRGRAFSANTEGLPGELPPNGDAFSGSVSIPLALLDGAESLSMTLTDYPDQALQLQISDIPLAR